MSDFKLQSFHSSRIIVDRRKLFSLYYHRLFDYPLNTQELSKWQAGNVPESFNSKKHKLGYFKGYFFIDSDVNIVYKRMMKMKISQKKLTIAKKASHILSKIPSVKLVGVTGSLAMENTDDNSDIDLMIITYKKTLWVTRILVLLSLAFFGFPVRRAGKREQKDMICPNVFMDESNLVWRKRNIFTAHEIVQIIPLVNKDAIFERFIEKNKWVKIYWPNIKNVKGSEEGNISKYNGELFNHNIFFLFAYFFEPIAYLLQRMYMKKKITREVVSPTRALFHPSDLGKMVLKKLDSSLAVK